MVVIDQTNQILLTCWNAGRREASAWYSLGHVVAWVFCCSVYTRIIAAACKSEAGQAASRVKQPPAGWTP